VAEEAAAVAAEPVWGRGRGGGGNLSSLFFLGLLVLLGNGMVCRECKRAARNRAGG
jgi:hypothetical protein